MALVATLAPSKPLVVVSTSNSGGGLNPANVTMRAGGVTGDNLLDYICAFVDNTLYMNFYIY